MRNLAIKAAAWKQARPIELKDEEGQTVVEYALVVGVVSLALIILLAASGTTWITDVTAKVSTKIAAIG